MSKYSLRCLSMMAVSVLVLWVLVFVPAAHAADSSVGFDSASGDYSGYPDNDAYITLVRSGTNLGRDYVDVEVVYPDSPVQYLNESYDYTFPDGKRVEFDDDQTTATLHVHITGRMVNNHKVRQFKLALGGTWYMDVDPAKSLYTANVLYPATPKIEFESATYGGKEGDAVQVVLTRVGDPSDNLQVSSTVRLYLIESSTATREKDYSTSLVLDEYVAYVDFGPGETRKVITFNLLNDAVAEGTETIDIGFYCNQFVNAESGKQDKTTITIADKPAEKPSQSPSQSPSQTPSPPTQVPSQVPSEVPSQVPSQVPSEVPSQVPSQSPSEVPSASPAPAPVPYLLLGVGAIWVLVLVALVAVLGLAAGYLVGKLRK